MNVYLLQEWFDYSPTQTLAVCLTRDEAATHPKAAESAGLYDLSLTWVSDPQEIEWLLPGQDDGEKIALMYLDKYKNHGLAILRIEMDDAPFRNRIMRALFSATFPRLGGDNNPLADRILGSIKKEEWDA